MLKKIGVRLIEDEVTLHKRYEEAHADWLKSLSEESWLKHYPKGFDSWSDGKNGHRVLTSQGQQHVIDLLNAAVDEIEALKEEVATLKATPRLGVDELLDEVKGAAGE